MADWLRAALGLRIEGAQGVDFISEPLGPHRSVEVRRENVEDSPADGKLPAGVHKVHAYVAALG